MIFSSIKEITLPEGKVKSISNNNIILWEDKTSAFVNRWNLKERIEFIGKPADGMSTMYFDASQVYSQNIKMPVSESIWYNSGRRIGNGVFYSTIGNNPCILSNITENSVTFNSGKDTEKFVAIPFHMNAGETFSLSYYSSGTNRSGYHIFSPDGTFQIYKLDNQSGAGNKTFEYIASEECWIAWQIGKYDANSSVTLSDIVLHIT